MPVAEEEVPVILSETKATLNTRAVKSDKTVENLETI